MKKIIFFTIIFNFLLISYCNASEATFESFYVTSNFTLVTALIVAILVGAAVYFTGGLASAAATGPIAWVGSTIGSWMGLSGAAATSAGLAFLGGGAVASGGLGMAGGAALLTAIFTFSSDVIVDYTMDKINSKRSYEQLVEDSKDLPNLPIIKNTDGPDEIEKVVTLFQNNYKDDMPQSSEYNQMILSDALSILNQYKSSSFTIGDAAKIHGLIGLYTAAGSLLMGPITYLGLPSMYDNVKEISSDRIKEENLRIHCAKSIIYFQMNDYKMAGYEAEECLNMDISGEKNTIPRFISSISNFVTNKISKDTSLDLFRTSIKLENDNKLIPLLYTIYSSRIASAGLMDFDILSSMSRTLLEIDDKDVLNITLDTFITTLMARIKICQSNIITIYNNKDSEYLDRSLLREKSDIFFNEYKQLIPECRYVLNLYKDPSNLNFILQVKETLEKYEEDTSRLEGFNREI